MKNIISIFLFLLVVVLHGMTSCSEEHQSIPLSSKLLLNQPFSIKHGGFVWNGDTLNLLNSIDVEFEQIEDDSTKMLLLLTGVLPNDDAGNIMKVVVDVNPMSDKIIFQGKLNYYGLYDLEVSGIYKNSDEPNINLNCNYHVVSNLTEHPFIFNFKQKSCYVDLVPTEKTLIDGKEYTYTEIANNVLENMNKLYADSDSAMQLSFLDNGELKISLLNNNGKTDVQDFMTVKYWFTQYVNDMIIEFNKEQAETFLSKFLNKEGSSLINLFNVYGPYTRLDADRYILVFNYWLGDRLGFCLAGNYHYSALKEFVKGRSNECDPLVKQQAKALVEYINRNRKVMFFKFNSEQ